MYGFAPSADLVPRGTGTDGAGPDGSLPKQAGPEALDVEAAGLDAAGWEGSCSGDAASSPGMLAYTLLLEVHELVEAAAPEDLTLLAHRASKLTNRLVFLASDAGDAQRRRLAAEATGTDPDAGTSTTAGGGCGNAAAPDPDAGTSTTAGGGCGKAAGCARNAGPALAGAARRRIRLSHAA